MLQCCMRRRETANSALISKHNTLSYIMEKKQNAYQFIAQEVGVSEATVSYVFNDKGNASQEVLDRIKAIVKRHTTTLAGRGPGQFPERRGGTIAVVFPHFLGSSYQPF